jgi:hypothetical protein
MQHFNMLEVLEQICPSIIALIRVEQGLFASYVLSLKHSASASSIAKRHILVLDGIIRSILAKYLRFDPTMSENSFKEAIISRNLLCELDQIDFVFSIAKNGEPALPYMDIASASNNFIESFIRHLEKQPNYRGQICHVEKFSSKPPRFRKLNQSNPLPIALSQRVEQFLNIKGNCIIPHHTT